MDLTRRRFLESVTTVGLSGAIAGCSGGDGGNQPTATATPTDAPNGGMQTPTSESKTTAQEKYPDYEWSRLDGATAKRTTEVTLRNFAYHPMIATVSPGTTVTFVNEDSTGHTVTIPKLGVDETIPGGGSTTITFEEAGTYDYVCTFHPPSMLGRIVVAESGDTNTPTSTATPSATATATPTPTPEPGTSAQEKYPDYEWSRLDGATAKRTTEVTLRNFAYHPMIATVSPGTTVTFVNEDSTGHTVTIPKLGIDRTIPGGGTTTITFEEAGTYDYVCTFHPPSMLGRIVVGETSGSTESGSGDGTPTSTPTGGMGDGY